MLSEPVDVIRAADVDETAKALTSVISGESITKGGKLRGFSFNNETGGGAHLQIFNAVAADVTVGTTVPVFDLFVPDDGSVHLTQESVNVPMPNGVSVAVTLNAEGSTAPTAAANSVRLYWQGS